MPVIRISGETLARMKEIAIPLEDTHDDVIKRLLDHYPGTGPDKARGDSLQSPKVPRPVLKVRKKKLPQKEFEIPVLETIFELGGKADVRDIRKPLYEKVRARLLEGDHDQVSSGDPRWWNAACWARNELKVRGLLKPNSLRGIWELSAKGYQYLNSHRKKN